MAEAADHTPYSAEYLSLLARKGKLPSKKINGVWYTTKPSLEEYMRKQMLRAQALQGDFQGVIPNPQPRPDSPISDELTGPSESTSAPVQAEYDAASLRKLKSFHSDIREYMRANNLPLPPEDEAVARDAHEAQKLFDASRSEYAERTMAQEYLPQLAREDVVADTLGAVRKETHAGIEHTLEKVLDKKLGPGALGAARVPMLPRKSWKTVTGSRALLALTLLLMVGLTTLPVPFVFSSFEKGLDGAKGLFTDANTVMGFRPGTHKNELLLLDKDGRIAITGSIETSGQLVSGAASGTAPILVTSATRVDNLNAQYLDGASTTDFTLAYVTKNGAFTTENVQLLGSVEVGKSLLVKGAAKLLSSLSVDGGLSVFGPAEFSDALTVLGPAHFRQLLSAEGGLNVSKNASIQGSLNVGHAVNGESASFGTLGVGGDFSAGGKVALGAPTQTLTIASKNVTLDKDGNLALTGGASASYLSVLGTATSTIGGPVVFTGTVSLSGTGAADFSALNVSGTTTLADLLVTGSTTLQDLTYVRATGTEATTTSLFSSALSALVGRITSLVAQDISVGALTATNSTTTNATTTSLSTGTLVATGSSTLQDLTYARATGTEATTTSLFSHVGTFDNVYVNNYQQNNGTFTINSTVPTGDIFSVFDTAVTNGTLIHQSLTANAGNGQASKGQIIDLVDSTTAGGGYSALTVNVTGAGTGSGSKLLFDLNPGVNKEIVFDSTGALRPTTDISQNTTSIGSPSFYFKNGYFDTLTANQISGNVISGGTSNSTWTVGTSQTGDVNEALIFQRNSGSGNALLSWNASSGTLNDQRFLSVNYPFNATYTVSDASIATTTSLYSGLLTNNTTAGTQKLLSLTNTGTGSTEDGIYIDNTGTGATALEVHGTWTTGILTNNNSVNAGTGAVSGGQGTFANLLATGSSTLQNFTYTSATGTSATTTSLFSANLAATAATLGTVLATGSSTLQNFTYTSATGTSATSTNLFATNGVITNLTVGTQNLTNLIFVNATGTSATTTNLYSTTASSTNLYTSFFRLGGTSQETDEALASIDGANNAVHLDIGSISSAIGLATNVSTAVVSLRGVGVKNAQVQFRPTLGNGTLIFDGSSDQSDRISNGTLLDLALAPHGGNVGIGISNPQATLEVAKNVKPEFRLNDLETGGHTWSLTSGSSTKGYFDITDLFTNKTALTIDTGGNVGIGITSPATKFFVHDGTGRNLGITTDAGQQGTSGIAIGSFNDTASAYAPLSLVGSLVTINSNVGIGTTNPQQKLVAVGNILAATSAGDTGGAPGDISLVSNGGSPIGSRLTYGTDGTGWKFAISKNTAGTVSDQLVVQDNGNVGIGTTTPLAQLSVAIPVGQTVTAGPNGSNLILRLHDLSGVATHNDWGLGTRISDNSLAFQDLTNNVTRMLIDGSGNIGIGTTNPAPFNEHLTVLSASGQGANSIFATNDFVKNTTGSALQISFGSSAGNTYANIGNYNTGGAATGNLVLNRDGGNVGIGTTNPSAPIDVEKTDAGSGNATLSAIFGRIGATPTATAREAGVAFSDANNQTLTAGITGIRENSVGNYLGGMGFYVHSTSGTPASAFSDLTRAVTILDGGNVGIGNTNPDVKLTVSDNGGSDAIRIRTSYAADYAQHGALTWSDATNVTGQIDTRYNGSSVDMAFGHLYNGGYTSNTLMTLRGNGNLGIGITNPSNKLVVKGNAISVNSVSTGNTMGYLGERGSGVDAGYLQLNSAGISAVGIDSNGSSFFNGGNVGIGTASPNSKLSVMTAGTSGIPALGTNSNGFSIVRSSDGVVGMHFGYDTATGNGYIQQQRTDSAVAYNLLLQPVGGNVGIGTTAPDAKLDVNGGILTEMNGFNSYHNVASYNNSGGGVAGTMEIALPYSWSNTMMTVTIRGYDYSANAGWEVQVSGYNYSGSPAWVNYKAEAHGNTPFNQVRLAYDSGLQKNVILLGTTGSGWTYPKVEVEEVIVGHSTLTGWGSGWTVRPITSEASISNIVNAPLAVYTDSSGNVGINNTSPGYKLDVGGSLAVTGGNALVARYTGTSASYHSSLDWNTLQLGNNGANDLVAGRTAANGYFRFFVNNTNDTEATSPNGSLALTINADTSASFASSVNAAAGATTGGYQIGTYNALTNDGNYTRIFRANTNTVGLYLGGADTGNYYDNSTHFFRSSGGGSYYGVLNGNGLSLGNGNTGSTARLDVYGTAWNNTIRAVSTGTSVGADFFINSTTREGAVYADSSGFGLLGSDTNWALRINAGDHYVSTQRELYPGNPSNSFQGLYYLAGSYGGAGLYTNNSMSATNFRDGTGSYNVNLGSGDSEGRGLVAGYSGGSYGGIGYNVRHTTTGATWVAPMADTSSYLLFNSGFTFMYAGSGTAGRTLSYSQLGRLDSSGNLTLNGTTITLGGYTLGIPASTYGTLSLQTTKGGYYGMLFGTGASNPNLMFDTSGNGGFYYESGTSAGWAQFYNRGTGHMSINSASDLGAALGVNGNITTNGVYARTSAGAGYLSGSYTTAETSATTGAIYTIGGSYVPSSTSLGLMYGIGYTVNNNGQTGLAVTGAPAEWGMYVASNGTARIFLDSDNGSGYFNGSVNGTQFNGSGAGLTGTASSFTAGNVTSLAGTWTGLNYFQSNMNTATGSNPPLMAYSTGGLGAIMSFHRGGVYAVNMGLDSDNVFRIGGWSAPANLLQMDMAGNLTMAGTGSFNTAIYGNGLAVAQTGDSYLRINQSNQFSSGVWLGTSDLKMYTSTLRIGSSGGTGEVEISGTSGDSTKRIQINGNSGGITYFNAGNVGVGTASPNAVLHAQQPASTSLSGTVAKANGSAVVTGTGTSFLAEIFPGDSITVPGGFGEQRIVLSVSSNTSLTVDSPFSNNASGQTAKRGIAAIAASNSGGSRVFAYSDYGMFLSSLNGGSGSGYVCYSAVTGGYTLGGGGSCGPSSLRFKHDVQDLSGNLDKVLALRPVSYTLNSDDSHQVGFVAEEVYKIEPRLVTMESDGTTIHGLNYAQFAPLLAGAIQELNLKTGAYEASTTAELAGFKLDLAAATSSIADLQGLASTTSVRVDSLETRVLALESASTSGLTLDATSTSSITSSVLATIGGTMKDTYLYIKALTVDKLNVGSQTNPTGITLYDSATGSPYCFRVVSGQSVTVPGECSSAIDLTQAAPAGGSTASSTSPTAASASSTPATDTASSTPATDTASSTPVVASADTATSTTP